MPYYSNAAKLLILLAAIGNVRAQTVTTTNGTIQGSKCNTSSANAFLGIPFALPPTRFAAPEPYNKTYDGVLDATAQPARCPQFGLAFVEYGPQSEDWYVCNGQVSDLVLH
jgi:carboxylesterase type B